MASSTVRFESMRIKSKNVGFTLIEVLITVTIIGVLAAIAIPAYRDAMNRSNRVDAIADLTDITQRLQRCFTAFGRFDAPNIPNPPGGCAVYNQLIAANGIETRKGFYNITLFDDGNAANNSFTYEIRARAISGRVQQNDTQCQMFSINQAGVRASTDAAGVDSTARCWR